MYCAEKMDEAGERMERAMRDTGMILANTYEEWAQQQGGSYTYNNPGKGGKEDTEAKLAQEQAKLATAPAATASSSVPVEVPQSITAAKVPLPENAATHFFIRSVLLLNSTAQASSPLLTVPTSPLLSFPYECMYVTYSNKRHTRMSSHNNTRKFIFEK